jgi:hypothetical protein
LHRPVVTRSVREQGWPIQKGWVAQRQEASSSGHNHEDSVQRSNESSQPVGEASGAFGTQTSWLRPKVDLAIRRADDVFDGDFGGQSDVFQAGLHFHQSDSGVDHYLDASILAAVYKSWSLARHQPNAA